MSSTIPDVTLFYRAIMTCPHDSGLPADSVVNTWAFTCEDAVTLGGGAIAITSALDAFYTSMNTRLSSQYNWNAATLEVINMLDDRPRIPIFSINLSYGGETTSAVDYPAEVAVCLSFKGATESGVNARRRRGRVYIGPVQFVTSDHPNVDTGFMTDLRDAGVALRDTALITWSVYSRYTHYGVPVGRNIGEKDELGEPVFDEIPDALPSSFTPVDSVWVDNAWDTQRRRGPKATTRLVG